MIDENKSTTARGMGSPYDDSYTCDTIHSQGVVVVMACFRTTGYISKLTEPNATSSKALGTI